MTTRRFLVLRGWENHRPDEHWQWWLLDRLLDELVALARRDSATEPAAAVAARIAGLLDDSTRCIVVAESDGELVGVVEAQFYGAAMRRGFGSARLHDLFVELSWRSRGIAGALLAEVKAWARALMSVSGGYADGSRDVSSQAGPSAPPADEPVVPAFISTKMTRVAVSPMFSP